MNARKLLILIFIVSACEEKIDLPLSPEETGLLVVEGMLTNENKNHLIKLSLPYGRQNGNDRPATGASVWIAEGSTPFVLTEFPTGSGNYYTPMRRAATGQIYTLYIQYNGNEYFARDSPVPVQPLTPLRYRETNEGYTLILDPSGQDPYYTEHILTWQNTSVCPSTGPCTGSVVFYDLKTIDVNEIFKSESEPFYFPNGTTVVRSKFSVSPAYKNFLRSMLSETQWRGGLFDVQRSNVPTNLSEGAVGFFAVCSVVRDTTVVQ